MSETSEAKQFLDKDGLDALWSKMCDTFPHKDALGNYLPLAGSTMTGTINSQSITPKVTNTYDLGTSSLQWNNIYGKTLYEDNVSLVNKYAPLSHTHIKSEITDFPASLKNPHSLIIQGNGITIDSYDGSATKTVNITAAGIGAAPTSHTHTVISTGNLVPVLSGTLTDGVLEITGATTDVSVTGITEPPGSDNSPESWFVDPTDMDALFA